MLSLIIQKTNIGTPFLGSNIRLPNFLMSHTSFNMNHGWLVFNDKQCYRKSAALFAHFRLKLGILCHHRIVHFLLMVC